MKRIWTHGLLAGLTLTACATAPNRQSPVVVPPSEGHPQIHRLAAQNQSYLVWLVGTKNQPEQSYLVVEQGGTGNCVVEAQAKGVWLTAGSDLWRWEEKRVRIPPPKGTPTGPDDWSSTIGWGELSSVVSGKSVRIDWPSDMDVARQKDREPNPDTPPNMVESSVHLEGSAGRWLIILHGAYTYAGGAHGNGTTDLRVWDLQDSREVNPKELLPRGEAWRRIEAEANRRLENEESGADEGAKARWVGLLPRYDKDGRLELGYVFAADACYACSHGPWTESYTVTERVSGPLPEVLTRYGTPPSCVRQIAHEHPETELGGWGEVADPAVLKKQFDKWFQKVSAAGK